jgi:TM2 domain-containing membrane protein YozV
VSTPATGPDSGNHDEQGVGDKPIGDDAQILATEADATGKDGSGAVAANPYTPPYSASPPSSPEYSADPGTSGEGTSDQGGYDARSGQGHGTDGHGTYGGGYGQGPSDRGTYGIPADEHSPYQPNQYPSPPSNQGPHPQGPYPQGQYPRGQYPQAPSAQAPYNQGGYNQGGYNQGPFGQPYAPQKSRVVAGVLGILLGSLGIHRFYLGFTTIGIIQILMSTVGAIFTFGLSAIAAGIWGLIEGIMILVGSEQFRRDAQGIPLKD